MDNIFIAANNMCGGGIEFFLEGPYLDNATTLLNVLPAHTCHPSASNVFVGSDISFCSPLSWCKGGITHYMEPKSRGYRFSVPKVLSFHPEGSVPFPLARDSFFTRQTSFSPAETWLPMGNSAFVRGDPDPVSTLLLCWLATILSQLPAQDCAVGVVCIPLGTDFSLCLPGPPQWVLTLLLGHLISSHSTQAAADLLQNWFLFPSKTLLSPSWPQGRLY